MIVAFAVFMAAAIGLPWAANRYLHTATAAEQAIVERQDGSVTAEFNGTTMLLERGGREVAPVGEGAIIATHGDGRAHVRLFNESTLNLESNTRLRLLTMRRPQFSTTMPAHIVIVSEPVAGGVGRFTVGTTWADTDMQIHVPDAVLQVPPESRLRVTVTDHSTTVYVQHGTVHVVGRRGTVEVRSDQITTVPSGGAPSTPGPALTNVLVNGDFRRAADTGWRPRTEGEPPGVYQPAVVDGRRAMTLQRSGSEGRPGDIVFEQLLSGYDLLDAAFIGITATFRIDMQSLPAGGERDQEYPLILKLVVERHDGTQDAPWEVGFYAVAEQEAEDLRPPSGMGILGLAVPAGRWVSFASGNLLDDAAYATLTAASGPDTAAWLDASGLLERIERFSPGPRRLLRFEVKASGHDWTTYLDRVGVYVK